MFLPTGGHTHVERFITYSSEIGPSTNRSDFSGQLVTRLTNGVPLYLISLIANPELPPFLPRIPKITAGRRTVAIKIKMISARQSSNIGKN